VNIPHWHICLPRIPSQHQRKQKSQFLQPANEYMKRSDFIKTKEGQIYERDRRLRDKISIFIEQEPNSKKMSTQQRKRFRQYVFEELKTSNRKAFRGDIILEIDFWTTRKNPPALQSLVKNYLDLLHKQMPGVDSYQKLLFNDDSQIKILIANYHFDKSGSGKPHVRISAYRYSHFMKDIQLVDEIRNDIELDEERISFNDSYIDDLIELEKEQEWYDKNLGTIHCLVQRDHLKRKIQEQFLRSNRITFLDLLTIFRSFLPETENQYDDQWWWNSSEKFISMTTNLIELGCVPVESGDSEKFRQKLENKLTEFKNRFHILFPLVHPIGITVFYTPPKHNILYLDNLARNHLIPLLIEICAPPASSLITHREAYATEVLDIEPRLQEGIPKYGITNYQIIHRPRTADTPKEGIVKFYITDGFFMNNNIWRMVDKIITRWIDS
jgi:hypothetical protein